MNHDVFISYSSQDMGAAQAICHVLEQNEIRCWMAPRNIPPGSDYGDVIDDAIKTCKAVVILFSETAATSQYVKSEINIAFEEQKTIIPFRLDQTPLKGQNRLILNKTHWIDAYPDYKTKFNDLLNAVSLSLGLNDNFKQSGKSNHKTIIRKYKVKYLAFATIISLLVTIVGYSFFINRTTSFNYNKNGIKVSNIKGLSHFQQKTLVEILDNMILIENGSFLMGNKPCISDYLTSLDSLSINPHVVELSSYYISKYELTQEQWKAFQNLAGCYIELGDKKAVDNVSWEEAVSYTDKLSYLTTLNFSLPTEAQWEYAAGSANQQQELPFAGFEEGIHHYAWTKADNLSSAAEVGMKLPNKLGLYDMTGNVSEWCIDDFSPYTASDCTDPVIQNNTNKKIYRGGDYRTPNMMDMKISSRYYAPAFTKREATGLRLVINTNK